MIEVAPEELVQIEQMLGSITLDEVNKLMAERSLYEFLKQAWPIIEPGRPFVDGWAVGAMCEHYEAVTRRQIRNLLVNIPPRSTKSVTTCVAWPCWVWINNPESRWLFASYAQTLSMRDSVKCRNVMQNRWYQNNWGDHFRFSEDQNTKGLFKNDKSGFRMSTSVGGVGTGEGGDYLVVDDPHNAMDAFSDSALESAVNWFKEVWSSRINDQSTGCKVVIMQRIHERDVSGHILEIGEDWTHLCLPMEFEAKRKCFTRLEWSDPRENEGELLCPERVNVEQLSSIKKALGSYGYAGQYQQSPAPRGGGMFKREWFGAPLDACPEGGQTCRYWDRAFTDDAGDWTAGVKLRKVNGLWYVMDVARFQTSAFGTETRISNIASSDGMATVQVLEEDPAAGKSEVAYLVRALAGKNVRKVKKRHNKELCAYPAACQAEAENIKLFKGPWNEVFMDELAFFPRGKNDDQVDGLSGAFNYLNDVSKVMFAI